VTATASEALRVGSLCTGYGGLDLAVHEVLGGDLAWVADNDPGACAILAHRYPSVRNLGDISTIGWQPLERVDLLTAGFPCQDISYAGRGEGIIEGNRSGLWYAIADAVGVLRPGLVVLENVAALVGRRPGLDVVLGDLARLGFDAQWTCLRAAGVGAPHGRKRIFLIAWPAEDTDRAAGDQWRQPAPGQAESRGPWPDAGGSGGMRAAPDADSTGRTARLESQAQRRAGRGACTPVGGAGSDSRDASPDPDGDGLARGAERDSEQVGSEAGHEQRRVDPLRCVLDWGIYTAAIRQWEAVLGRAVPRPTEPGRTGERLSPRFVEWMQGLAEGWVTDVPGLSRNQMLKALGNGVVPQQAAMALRMLLDRAGVRDMAELEASR